MENNFNLKKFLIENRAPQKEVVYEGLVGKYINKQIAKLGRSLGFKEHEFEFLSLDQIKQNIERLPESSMLTDNESGRNIIQDVLPELMGLVDSAKQKLKKKEHEGVTYYDANDVYRLFRQAFPDLIYSEDIRNGFAFYNKNESSEYNEELFGDMLALNLTGYFSDIFTPLPDGYKTDLGDFRIGEGMSPEEFADAQEAERLEKHPESAKIKDILDKLKPVSQKLDEEELNEGVALTTALAVVLVGLASVSGLATVTKYIEDAKEGKHGENKQKGAKVLYKIMDKIGREGK